MLLCGRFLLGARSPHVIFPRTLARKDYTPEAHTFGPILRDGPFLSQILILRKVTLENLTACFDPNFPSSRGRDFLG